MQKKSIKTIQIRIVIHTYIDAYIHTNIHTYIHTYCHTVIHTYIPYKSGAARVAPEGVTNALKIGFDPIRGADDHSSSPGEPPD